VRARVAEVERDRVRAVLIDDRAQAAVDRLERLVPRRGHVHAVAAHERLAQAIGVAVELASAAPFGHTKPWLNASLASPRIETTSRPDTSSSRPQAASQIVHWW
jgi:hypothetical protein